MRRIISIFAASVALQAAAATWTLDECIDYAVSHNLTVATRQLQEEEGRLEVTQARDAYLPTLSAGANQGFDFGRGLTSQNTYADRNTTTFGWSANMSLPLFQGLQAIRREKLAKANLATIVEQTESARDDVTLNVMAAYLQALYTSELTDVASHQVELSATELNRRRTLADNGKLPESDVIEARAQLAADSLTLVSSANDARMALLDLAQLMRVDFTPDFNIAPLSDERRLTPTADEVYARALEVNHSLIAARLDIKAADRQISLAQAGYLPRVNFNLGAGSSYYHLHGENNPSFGRQMRDNYATSLGFSLQIPVFDAFSTRNSIRQARLRRQQAELAYDEAADRLYREINQAYYQATGAEAKLAAARSAVESTAAALESMTVKYNYGAATATEYETAKTAYIRAVAEEIQARYEQLLRNRVLAFYCGSDR